MAEVTAIKTLDDSEALEWLRAQPNGRITLPPTELGRRWGWPRYKVTRRLKAWSKAGHVTRRGNTLMVPVGAVEKTVARAHAQKKQHLDNTPVLHGLGAASVAAPNSAHATDLVAPFVAPQPVAPVAAMRLLPQPKRTSRPLVAIAYGFFGLGIGINVWNAWTGGALTDMALPATWAYWPRASCSSFRPGR
jgi:hypothetical protein